MQKNKQVNKKGAKVEPKRKSKVATSGRAYTFVPFVVFALALITETCLVFKDGTGVVGNALHSVFTGLFGAVAYLIPAGAIVIAYLYFDMNKRRTTVYKVIMLAVFVLFFAAADSVLAFDKITEEAFSASVSWNGGKAGQGGGFFGGLIGKLFSAMFGRIFGAVVCIFITVLSLSFFIGSAFPGVWGLIFSRKKAVKNDNGASDDGCGEPLSPTGAERKPEQRSAPAASPFAAPAPKPNVREYPTDIPKASHKKVETTVSDPFSYGDVFLQNMSDEAERAPEKEAESTYVPEQTAYSASSYASSYASSEEKRSYSETRPKTETAKPKSGSYSYGKTSGKNSRSKVYSPFADPFVSMEDVFGDGSGSSGGGSQKRKSTQKSMAYSPFENPFMDVDESLKEVREKDSRSQAYIAYESTVDPSERAARKAQNESTKSEQSTQSTQSEQATQYTQSTQYAQNDDAGRAAYNTQNTQSSYGANGVNEVNAVDMSGGASYGNSYGDSYGSQGSPSYRDDGRGGLNGFGGAAVTDRTDRTDRTERTSGAPNDFGGKREGSVLTPYDYETMKPLGSESRAPARSDARRPIYDEYSEDAEAEPDDEEELDVFSSTENVRVTRGIPSVDDESRERSSGDGDRCITPRSEKRYPNYVFPEFGLLDPQMQNNAVTEEDVLEVKNKLLGKLASFRVEASLSGYSVGPTVTRYELTPGPGVKVKAITSLIEDIALELQSDGVRIATVPGRSVIGVEVPNKKVTVVSLRSLIENRDFINAKSKITVCVGLTVTGKPVYMDIDDMPHVLIAGQTKAGKSVAINCMLLSLLYRATPDEVQLILIDPKRVELNIYSKLPHLVMPVIDDPQRAAAALSWAVTEMERRYALLDKYGVRNREEYYELKAEDPSLEIMPQIVIVIDELADLMLQVREHVESLINRLAAMARACGIHLLIGTQRPSVDIITGLIKANIPARIAFKVSSSADSRIILGNIGAEKLLGRGDMLYQATGCGRVRVQGAFVTSNEIKRITRHIIENNGEAQFDPEIMRHLDNEVDKMNKDKRKGGAAYGDGDDESGVVDTSEVDFDYLCRAIEYAIETDRVATNNIQRHLRIGFNRAADIVDRMEELGFISPRNGSKPREVLVTWEKYEQWKYNRMA